MKNKIMQLVVYFAMAVVGAGALGFVAATALTFSAFLPGNEPSGPGLSPGRSVSVRQDPAGPGSELPGEPFPAGAARSNPPAAAPKTTSPAMGGNRAVASRGGSMKTDGPGGRTETAGAMDPSNGSAQTGPQGVEELDRAFEGFLTAEGLSTEALEQEIASPLPPPGEAETASTPSEPVSPVFARATEALKDEYPVSDARLQENGEVWVRVEPGDSGNVPVGELMARAAEMYGDAASPVKVVVWSGNRAIAVRTFFGDPMF